MSNILSAAVGTAASIYAANKADARRQADRAAWYAKMGMKMPEEKPGFLDEAWGDAKKWVGEKLSPSASTPVPAAPAGAVDPYPDQNPSTWDRLTAGNIDQPGSEAYNKYGKGHDDAVMADIDNEWMRHKGSAEPLGLEGAPVTPEMNEQQQQEYRSAWSGEAGNVTPAAAEPTTRMIDSQ